MNQCTAYNILYVTGLILNDEKVYAQWLNYSARCGGSLQEGPKLEPEGQRAEVGFPTADHWVFEHSMDSARLLWHLNSVYACNIYLHQAWTNANDKMTVKDYIFLQNIMHTQKNTQNYNCAEC